MEKLFEKLLERLGEVKEIRYVDLNAGQLQLEKPPLAYPAVLISIMETREDIDSSFQIVTGQIELTIIDKYLSETNNLAPGKARNNGLRYMKLNDAVFQNMQGYSDDRFEAFTNRQRRDVQLRAGLKTVVQTWETAWKESVPAS